MNHDKKATQEIAYKLTGCSIHTFEIKIPLANINTITHYKSTFGKQYKVNQEYTDKLNKTYYSTIEQYKKGKPLLNYTYRRFYTAYYPSPYFQKYGISDLRYIEVHTIGKQYNGTVIDRFFLIRVNPRKLLGYENYNHICLVPEEDIKRIAEVLENKMIKMGFSPYDIDNMKIHRLDICTNINLGSEERVSQYLQILRKGGCFRSLRHKIKEYDSVQHRCIFPNNEILYANTYDAKNKRLEISIYDKKKQMESQGNYYSKNPSEITEATGQLRIELRICSSKLNYHNKKINGDFFADIFNLSHKFGEDLKSYLGIMFGTGRIVTIEKAKTIIEQSSHHRETKDKMIEIIKNTAHRDMDFAFRELKYLEKSRFIKYFNNLGISPITVPKVWKTEFKSPIDYIETNNVNQR